MRDFSFSSARGPVALLAVLVSVAGCATKQDIRDLQTEIADQLRQVAAAQDSLRQEIRQQSIQTQDTLRNASRELVDIRGDVLNTLNRIGTQIGQIRELVGQNSLSIASLRDQMELTRRGGAPAGAAPGGAVDDSGEPVLSSGTGDADAMYNAAIRQFQRGSLSAARAAFQQFLTGYPSHELAPQAHYYLADILVQEDELESAIEAFAEIPELFPTADVVPNALYRMGVLHAELGNVEEARSILERVVNTYPDTTVAALAQDRLSELGGRPL
jgi:tol-pal system protein YbgF